MKIASLRSALVRRTIRSINDGRIEDFLALFAPGAMVADGPSYRGAKAIRQWAQRETFGLKMRIDVVRQSNAAGTVVRFNARSRGGYSGPGTFSFTIRKGLIERLEID